jgi:Skp family chaperone for outer membrane proteins
MRKIIMMAAMLTAFAAPGIGHAADNKAKDAPAAPVSKIAVVDVQGLVADSKAGKSIQSQIQKQRESFQAEFSSLEKELGDLQKKLSDEKADQNSKEFQAKRKEFETKMANANNLVQKRRQSLEKGAADAVLELRKEIVKIVADIADKEKYTIVISRQDVILVEKDMDITGKVLAELDKKLSDVKLKLDSAPAEAPKKK